MGKRFINIYVKTKRDTYNHLLDYEGKDFNILSSPLQQLTEYILKYQDEGILDFCLKMVDEPYDIYSKNLLCNIEIKLNNTPLVQGETYIYGPTYDKHFDTYLNPIKAKHNLRYATEIIIFFLPIVYVNS